MGATLFQIVDYFGGERKLVEKGENAVEFHRVVLLTRLEI